MSLIIPANSASAGGYDVDNSCRFQDSDSSEMSRAIASTGNNQTWTVSAWVKRVELGQSTPIFGTGDGSANNDARMVFFDADDKIECSYYNSGFTYEVTTNRLFRDVSAWYHICILFDTTESTASNRVKIYVNGTQETSLATASYPSENASFNFGNTSYTHYVNDMGGRNIRGSSYISELVYLDGTASAVTNFGEFDGDSGIWKAIDVEGLSGSKGTNGVYFDFEDSANLGNDVWGGTDFTEAGLDAQNQTTDTCTNNGATWNSLDNYAPAATFAEGNLQITTGGSNIYSFNNSTIAVSSGKWYAEVKVLTTATNNFNMIGISALSPVYYRSSPWGELGGNAYAYAYVGYDGKYYTSGSYTDYGDTYSTSIIGIYLDLDNNKLYFSKDGALQNSGTGITITAPASTPTGHYFFSAGNYIDNNAVYSANFGSAAFAISSANADDNGYGAFEYSPNITGDSTAKKFYTLNTKNLAEFG